MSKTTPAETELWTLVATAGDASATLALDVEGGVLVRTKTGFVLSGKYGVQHTSTSEALCFVPGESVEGLKRKAAGQR